MTFPTRCLMGAMILVGACVFAQDSAPTQDPFPKPINATDDVIRMRLVEFATLPDIEGQREAPRPMTLIDVPASKRLFVNDMRGPLYSLSYDGRKLTKYLDVNAPEWKVPVQFQGEERGVQSFAFHPEFGKRGSKGYGKFYTYTDTSNMTPEADFKPTGKGHTHDTVLLEWTAKSHAAEVYDGGAPRELMRFLQPFGNHNGGHIGFNPLAGARDEDYGLLFIGSADGGSGGDPYNMAQDLKTGFGKVFRIDPMGTNSANGKYGIPASNPFVTRGAGVLGEIYAYGIRNVQKMFWDAKTRQMFVSDIGQNAVEEISPMTKGANLGWNVWEGSYRYAGRGRVTVGNPRADASMTYPVAEYDHADPILLRGMAAVGGFVYRHKALPQLTGKLVFSDFPSGEIFYVNGDHLPQGGQEPLRRILFEENGALKTMLQLIQAKNAAQGKRPAGRADVRFGEGPGGAVFILNKQDNTIRKLVSGAKK